MTRPADEKGAWEERRLGSARSRADSSVYAKCRVVLLCYHVVRIGCRQKRPVPAEHVLDDEDDVAYPPRSELYGIEMHTHQVAYGDTPQQVYICDNESSDRRPSYSCWKGSWSGLRCPTLLGAHRHRTLRHGSGDRRSHCAAPQRCLASRQPFKAMASGSRPSRTPRWPWPLPKTLGSLGMGASTSCRCLLLRLEYCLRGGAAWHVSALFARYSAAQVPLHATCLQMTPQGLQEVRTFDTVDGLYDCCWSEVGHWGLVWSRWISEGV